MDAPFEERLVPLPNPGKIYSKEENDSARLFIAVASWWSMLRNPVHRWYRQYTLRLLELLRAHAEEYHLRMVTPTGKHALLGLIAGIEMEWFDGIPKDDDERPIPGAKCVPRGKRADQIRIYVRQLLEYLYEYVLFFAFSHEACSRLGNYNPSKPLAGTWLAAGELIAASRLDLRSNKRAPELLHWAGLARQLAMLLFPRETASLEGDLCATYPWVTEYRFFQATGLDPATLANPIEDGERMVEEEPQQPAPATTVTTTVSTGTHTTVTTTTVSTQAAPSPGFAHSPPPARRRYKTAKERTAAEAEAFLGYSVQAPKDWRAHLDKALRARKAARKVAEE